MAKHDSFSDTVIRAAITSVVASAASAAALMLLGHREHGAALRPMNATSHWLQGQDAGRRRGADLGHTAVGLVTHHLASMFWSLVLEKALGPRRRTMPELAASGALTAALAAAVDYLVMPRRLSPGWELALTRKSMAEAFAAMAAGLAAGAFAARETRARRRSSRSRRADGQVRSSEAGLEGHRPGPPADPRLRCSSAGSRRRARAARAR
jgi:hypothetical protein